MEIQFQEYNGSCFALNPRIAREAQHLTLKLDEKNCTHFLIFSCAPGGSANLSDPRLQTLLRESADLLLDAESEMLTEDLTVRCVSYRDYRMNNYAIDLPGRIAEYTVYGCRHARRQEPETLSVFLPQDQMCNSAIVSITLTYHLDYFSGSDGKTLGRQSGPYYTVQFDDIPDYQDGGIVYKLADIPFRFPITKEMLGKKRLYIDAGLGEPKFKAAVPGLTLKKI